MPGSAAGLLTGALALLFARLHLGFVVGLCTGKTLGGARLDLGFRLADGLQARLTPRQLFGEVQPFGQGLRIGRLGAGQKLGHLHLQLGLDLLGMPIRQGAMARGVGVHLGPIQGHRPELQELHLLRDAKDLYEQGLNLLEEPLAERAQRIVIRVGIGREVAKRQRVVGGLLIRRLE